MLSLMSIILSAQSTYNYKGSGVLNALTSWTLSPGGTNPADFTSNNQTFVVTNISAVSLSAAGWTVSGTGSQIQVGNGVSGTNLSIANTSTLMVSGGAQLVVANSGTLTLYNPANNLPAAANVTLNVGSTVNWAQTTYEALWPLTYQNLVLSGYLKKLSPGITTVQNIYQCNNFTMDLVNSATLQINAPTVVTSNIYLRSTNTTGAISIGGTSTNSVTLVWPGNDQTFGAVNITRNAVVRMWHAGGTYLYAQSGASLTAGTLDLTGMNGYQVFFIGGNITFGGGVIKASANLGLDIRGTTSGNLLMDQTSASTRSLRNLYANKLGITLTIGNALDIYGDVIANYGTINSNGNITLKSTATQKGRIAALPATAATGDFIGNVTVETLAKGGYTGYATLAVAGVNGQTMGTGWGDNFPMTCPTGCPNGSTVGGSPFTSVTKYDETTNTYPGIASGGDPIVPGTGYWVYLGNGQPNTTDITINVGPNSIVKRNATYWNLTYSAGKGNGFNLLGNPYPSTISFTKTFGASYGAGKMTNVLYVWNTDLNGGNGDYATYQPGVGSTPAVSSGGVDDNIPTGQAFNVQANTAFKITWNESFKPTANSANPLLRLSEPLATPAQNHLFYLNLIGQGYNTYMGINFNSQATLAYDKDYDAQHIPLPPGYAQIYNIVGERLKVNSIPSDAGVYTLPITAVTGKSGTYQIALNGKENLPSGICLVLIDNQLHTSHNLLESPYSVTLSDNELDNRFELKITINTSNILLAASAINQPNCYTDNNGMVVANASGAVNYNFIWKDQNNNVLRTAQNTIGKDTLKNIPQGNYFVEVSSGNCDNVSSGIQVIAKNATPFIDFSMDKSEYEIGEKVSLNNLSSGLTEFEWTFGDNHSSKEINPTYVYTEPGNYAIVLNGKNACGNAVSIFKDIAITSVRLNNNQPGVPVNALLISKDETGYYVGGNYANSTPVNIYVTDMLGRTIIPHTIVNLTNNKFYLKGLPQDQILVISADDGYNRVIQKILADK